jgi:hypothetical protein
VRVRTWKNSGWHADVRNAPEMAAEVEDCFSEEIFAECPKRMGVENSKISTAILCGSGWEEVDAFGGLEEDVAAAAEEGDALHGGGFGEAGLDEDLVVVAAVIAVGELGDEVAQLLEGDGSSGGVGVDAGVHGRAVVWEEWSRRWAGMNRGRSDGVME